MDPVKVELLIEFAVVLCAPPLYQYYLWRRGMVKRQDIIRTAKIFAPLYVLIGAAVVVWAVHADTV